MLATAGNTLKLWNTQNYSLYQEIPSSNGRIIGFTWNQDGQCLAGLGESGAEITLSAVNAKSAATIGVLRGVDSPTCIKFASRSPHYLGIGSKDGTVAIWNVKSQAQRKVFSVTESSITKISFSHNDSHIAAASKKGAIFLLSVVNNHSAGPFKVFDKKAVTDLVYSRAKKSLIGCCSEEGSVSMFDSHASKVIHSFKGAHAAPAACVAFSPVNELLMISVGYDKKFACYNVQTKQPLMTHRSSAPLTSAAFLSGGQQVALGTMTGQVFIHDLRTLRTPIATIQAHNKTVSSIIMQPTSKTVSERGVDLVKKSTKQKNNNDGHMASPHTASKSSSDDPSTQVLGGYTCANRKTSSVTEMPDPSEDLLSLDVFSPIRSSETAVKANIENVKENFSLEKHGSRESLGMDDVLSPVRSSQSHQVHLSPTNAVQQINIDDDIFSPVRETAAATGLIKNTLTRESYKRYDCEDDLLSPIRFRSHSPNVPQVIVSNDTEMFEAGLALEGKSEKGKENVQPSDLGIVYKDQEKVTHGQSTGLEEPLPASVLSLHNPIDDKIKNIISSQTSDKKVVHDSKVMNRIATPTQQLDKIQDTQKVESSPGEIQLQSLKMNLEEGTTPRRYQYARSSPPHKRALLHPSPLRDLSSIQSTGDQHNKLDVSPKPNSLDNTNKPAEATPVFQVDLVRNCMAEVLEEFQDDVNRRLMHLQCVMIKQFLKHQETMDHMLRQYSLNEDLLEENEKLRQEIKHLKANY